jgi:serine/threonine-protein kinase
MDKTVEELVAMGNYADAAALAEREGAAHKAAELYERIWDFRAAARCARLAGDSARALKNALDGGDEEGVEAAIAELEGKGQRDTAIDVLAKKGKTERAGRLLEAAGDLGRAAELYKSGKHALSAARVLTLLEHDREAGQLLERFIAIAEAGPEKAEAELLLGQILSQRLEHDKAAKQFQNAQREPGTRARANRLLIYELVHMGHFEAARDALLAARKEDAELPASLDEYLQKREPPPVRTRTRDVPLVAGRYRIGDPLGGSSSGRVHRAFDEVAGTEVAIKLFHTASVRGSQAFERFVREATVASEILHPHVVRVHRFSSDPGYLVMEYLAGGSLRARLDRDGKLSEPQTRRLLLELLDGLDAAHQRGVVHRDIKPANIFFDSGGSAKLGDFGVAHLVDLGQTQTGGLIGTLAYMSPEQITGARITVAADLYALGIVAFECLTGRLPFLGPDYIAEHLGETAPLSSQVLPELGERWDALLSRLLEKDPGARFESVDAVKQVMAAMFTQKAGQNPLSLRRAPSERVAGDDADLQAERSETNEDSARYTYETPIADTKTSKLSRALDNHLNRSVILERFLPDHPDDAALQRLYALAGAGGPYLQRVLAYDREHRIAVFEAPAGAPLFDATVDWTPRLYERLRKCLARGVRDLHDRGFAHGAIDANHVVIDDDGNPTLLVAGTAAAEITREADESAIETLIASLQAAQNLKSAGP